jgi:hypothetical protein
VILKSNSDNYEQIFIFFGNFSMQNYDCSNYYLIDTHELNTKEKNFKPKMLLYMLGGAYLQAFEIKRGLGKSLEGDGLFMIAKEVFGNAEKRGEKVIVTYGALAPLEAEYNGKELLISTTMKKDVDPETASNTIKMYNKFLENATGYTSKERAKKLQKKAKEGKL